LKQQQTKFSDRSYALRHPSVPPVLPHDEIDDIIHGVYLALPATAHRCDAKCRVTRLHGRVDADDAEIIPKDTGTPTRPKTIYGFLLVCFLFFFLKKQYWVLMQLFYVCRNRARQTDMYIIRKKGGCALSFFVT
jgi:hypothetical protein